MKARYLEFYLVSIRQTKNNLKMTLRLFIGRDEIK
jgi:hypothetical protein